MHILAAQIQVPPIDTRSKQIAYIEGMISKLDKWVKTNPVDLVMLPELATMEYSTPNFQNIDLFSEDLYGETFSMFSSFCKDNNVAICYGMPRTENGENYISQVVLGRRGEYLTHYDKIHTAEYGDSSEVNYFRRGGHLSVFEIDGIRAGIIICYDMRFPELTRRLCLELEVDVILHPVAFAQDCSFHSWQHFAVSRALENQVYFVSLNRGGPHYGHSIICPPWIDDKIRPIVMTSDEEFRIIHISRETIDQVRRDIPFRADALQTYQSLPIWQAIDI